jgi:hypothetical protein
MLQKSWYLLLFVVLGLIVLAGSLHAKAASAALNGQQNMDGGLQNGSNNLTGCVYALPLKVKTLRGNSLTIPAAQKIGDSAGRLPRESKAVDLEVCR